MVEMIQVEYPKMYIRIYERRKLESKIRSKNVYMLIKGEYYVPSIANSELNSEESKEDELQFGKAFLKQSNASANSEVRERIKSVDVFVGSKAKFALT